MGLYDIFDLDFECPKCGTRFVDHAQTKSLHCELNIYHLGAPIDWPDDIIFVYSYCNQCEKTLFQGIKIENGHVKEKTVTYLKGDLPGGLDKFCGEIWFPSVVAEYLEDIHGVLV